MSQFHFCTFLRNTYLFSYLEIQGQESDSSETSVRGPRIKHVCRRAAVALGRKRAVFPDDMPTLSALPWEEREKILSSMGNDGKASNFHLWIHGKSAFVD